MDYLHGDLVEEEALVACFYEYARESTATTVPPAVKAMSYSYGPLQINVLGGRSRRQQEILVSIF
jgi:hypothetical protein